jgi:hypothetical protein
MAGRYSGIEKVKRSYPRGTDKTPGGTGKGRSPPITHAAPRPGDGTEQPARLTAALVLYRHVCWLRRRAHHAEMHPTHHSATPRRTILSPFH